MDKLSSARKFLDLSRDVSQKQREFLDAIQAGVPLVELAVLKSELTQLMAQEATALFVGRCRAI